ncbi:MAG TPA: hypothetical protein PK876_00615 [Elusimicrobiota bacterium]|nr:hypothetical protein [Elusimicrobiota bacterium]
MSKRLLFFCAALILLTAPLRAAVLMSDLIDVPTAETVDHYGYNVSFRFYSGGGVLSKMAFGVFPRLNIGFGLDTEQFVGQSNPDLNRPTLNVKFRFFDGQRNAPALALGYDSQGYFYNDSTDKYIQREKGLYLTGMQEVLAPNLNLHAGLNMYDFSDDTVYGFTGVSYLYQMVAFMAEVDNIHVSRWNRINLGLRYHVTDSFSVDIASRDLWAAGRDDERIIRLNYFGSF